VIQWGHEKKTCRSRIQTVCDEPDRLAATELHPLGDLFDKVKAWESQH
jgi:hypothetical protein